MADEETPLESKTIDAAQLQALGITGGVSAAVAIVIARLIAPDSGSPTLTATQSAAVGPTVPEQQGGANAGVVTRLVSCGDSNQASVSGNDRAGSIVLGPGAAGACTLLFERAWTRQPVCVVTGGTIQALTLTDLVVNGADGAVTYKCGAVEP
jgi:hypothetical protein